MEKELSDYLLKRYPDLFFKKDSEEITTILQFGIECGDGWFNIINNICLAIESHISTIVSNNLRNTEDLEKIKNNQSVPDWVLEVYKAGNLVINPVPEYQFIQIKEKFGHLRIYGQGSDDYIQGIIHAAENLSTVTCEICGKPGEMRRGGWIRVLCDEHASDEQKMKSQQKIEVGETISVLANGKTAFIEIIEVISENEVKGKDAKVNRWGFSSSDKNKSANTEYFLAKYIKNNTFSYWNAIKIDV